MARGTKAARYENLHAFLRNEIAEGRYKVGDRLPTEPQLCAMCDVSRTTIRSAIGKLVEEGLLSREQGRGTFVIASPSAPKTKPRSAEPQSFQVLQAGLAPAPAEISSMFGVAPDADVYRVIRLRLVDKVPISIKRYYAPVELFGGEMPTKTELEAVWFDSMLHSRRVFIARTNITARPMFIEGAEAELLKVKDGALGLFAQRIGYNEASRIIRVSETVLVSDRATLHWTVRHPYGQAAAQETINFSSWTSSALD